MATATSIRELSYDVSSTTLKEWMCHLPCLEALWLQSGKSLDQSVEENINQYCPQFKKLVVYKWKDVTEGSAERDSERFLKGLRLNTLEYFEIIDWAEFGPASMVALSSHFGSLVELRLKNFWLELVRQLSLLDPPEKLEVLTIYESYGEDDELASDFGRWIGACKSLRRLEIHVFLNEPLVLANALNNTELSLEALIVPDYVDSCTVEEIEAFHEALASQRSLRELNINVDVFEVPDRPVNPATLLRSLQQLTELRNLDIQCVSQEFTQDQVVTLVSCLPHLERLAIGGTGFNDSVWKALLCLSNLRYLKIAARRNRFTAQGILDFIRGLEPQNRRFHLELGYTRTEGNITEEDQVTIREELSRRLDGSFKTW
ncbi:hypothetical protein VTN96DRAFT_1067 [Rasamsonia emersonii]